jgi:aquaporin related protein
MPQNISNILPLYDNKKKEKTGTNNGRPAKRNTTNNSQESSPVSQWRNELVAMAAEFAGTFMFLFFAYGGTQVANTSASAADPGTAGQENGSITQAPNTSVLMFIALSFGFSLMVNVWVFFRVSGGLFNPAVRAPWST